MLVDFTVKNFRSIRDEQTFSFYAQNHVNHFAGSIHYPSSEKLGILASAGIYGANASGKSTVLDALKNFFDFISNSHRLSEGDSIEEYQPYRLSAKHQELPSCFAIEFIVDRMRYVYEIELDAKRIISERLDFYSQGASRQVRSKLFERAKNATWEDITFGTYFKGGTRKIPVFDNQAYLSKAGNSPDAPGIIRKVYQFFRRNVIFAPKESGNQPGWRKDQDLVNQVGNFLSLIDTGISRVVIKKEQDEDFIRHLPEDLPDAIKSRVLEEISLVNYFEHKAEDGRPVLFTENEESDGTQALFHSLPLLFHVLKEGRVLIWDELESSLHPHVSELVVSLFNNPAVNRHHAQLLFTTHNLDLMDSSKMRKDQLWLTEKVNGATQLISLDEFDSTLKPSSPFAKWYDEGRLGGLPAIGSNKIEAMLERWGENGGRDA